MLLFTSQQPHPVGGGHRLFTRCPGPYSGSNGYRAEREAHLTAGLKRMRKGRRRGDREEVKEEAATKRNECKKKKEEQKRVRAATAATL